jgi:hypothetical protein
MERNTLLGIHMEIHNPGLVRAEHALDGLAGPSRRWEKSRKSFWLNRLRQ